MKYGYARVSTVHKKQIDHALQLKETHSYTQVESMTGISKSTLIRSKRRAEAGEKAVTK